MCERKWQRKSSPHPTTPAAAANASSSFFYSFAMKKFPVRIFGGVSGAEVKVREREENTRMKVKILWKMPLLLITNNPTTTDDDAARKREWVSECVVKYRILQGSRAQLKTLSFFSIFPLNFFLLFFIQPSRARAPMENAGESTL